MSWVTVPQELGAGNEVPAALDAAGITTFKGAGGGQVEGHLPGRNFHRKV